MPTPIRSLRLFWTIPLLLILSPNAVRAVEALPGSPRPACGIWTIVPSPGSGTPNAYLEGVGGRSGNDVWAVGHRSNYSDTSWQPLVRHWNGAAWTALAAPSTHGRFFSVAAVSRTDAWAVGEGPILPVIAHWNGIAWKPVASPQVTYDSREPAVLLGVAAVGTNDVWAVGFDWHYQTRQLIEHWNGRRWRVVPGVPSGTHPLRAIAALSATNIWAVGDGIEHWNGSQWTLVPAPAAASAITAVTARDIWAAGGGRIEHWNGSSWRIVPSPPSGEQLTTLTGISALAPDDVWAVGYAGHTVPHDGYAEHPFVEHWDGSSWRIVPTPATGSPDSQILAVTSTPSRALWAVGFAGTHRAGNAHALIEVYTPC